MRETPHLWFWKDTKGNWSEAVPEVDFRKLIDAGAITEQTKIKSPTRTDNNEVLAAKFPPVAKLFAAINQQKADKLAEANRQETELANQMQQNLLRERETTPLVHIIDQSIDAIRDELRLLRTEVSTNTAWTKKISDDVGCLLTIFIVSIVISILCGAISVFLIPTLVR